MRRLTRRRPLADPLHAGSALLAMAGVAVGYFTAVLTAVGVVPVWSAATVGVAALLLWWVARDPDLRRAALFTCGAGVGSAVIRLLIEAVPW